MWSLSSGCCIGPVTYLQTGKPSRCITNINVNSAFHPSGVGKLSGQSARQAALCDFIWQVKLRIIVQVKTVWLIGSCRYCGLEHRRAFPGRQLTVPHWTRLTQSTIR